MEFMMALCRAHCRVGAKSQRLAIFYPVPKIMSNYSRRILCAIVCLLESVCFAQTPAVRNAGVFTNTQINEYVQSLINGCSPQTEYQTVQGSTSVFQTEGAV